MITQYRPAYYDNPRASTLSGLSTDQKPTDVENGARYEEIDTGKTFCFDKENKAWYEMPQSGGGGSSVSVEPITITKNGVTTAPDGVAYSPITTDTYTQDGDKITITEDDGSKVVFTQGEAQAEKRETIVLAGLDDITPDSGFDYMGKVNAFVASEYAELQNPTGTMPTYEIGVVEFANELYPVNSFVLTSIAFNSFPDFANPPVTMWLKTTSPNNPMQNCEIVLYAETSGTLTKELFGEIFGDAWTFGDMVVSKGWNLAETNNGVMSVAAASTNEANTILGPIPLNPMPVFDLSAMDAYQKSFYKVGGIAYDAVSPNAASIVCGKTIAGVEGTATITSIIKEIITAFGSSQKGLVLLASETPVSTFQHDSLIGAKDFLVLPQVSKGSIAFVIAETIYTVTSIDGKIYGAMPKEGASISFDPSTGTITATSDSGEAPTFWGQYLIIYM